MKLTLTVDGKPIVIAPNVGSVITVKDLNNINLICHKLNKLDDTFAEVNYETPN